MGSVRLKVKGIAHKPCSIVSKGLPSRVLFNYDTAIYMYTRIKQLSKQMAGGGSQVTHCRNEKLQIGGGGKTDPYGNGLELQISVLTHVQLNKDGYI